MSTLNADLDPSLIRCESLGKRFGDHWALRDVTCQIRRGDCVGLLGPNGAGKTTLIRLLTAQLAASEGSAHIAGFEVAVRPIELRRLVGVMPEEGALLEDLDGCHYLEFVGRMHGLPEALLFERLRELQDLLTMDFQSPVAIRDYSYGMKKKLALASALLHHPQLLFLDEPFEGLDPGMCELLLDLLRQLHEGGVTLILSSHTLSLVQRLCTRILLVDQGRLRADVAASDLRAQEETLEALFHRLVGRPTQGRLSWI
jgi:ABC-2 type transport system ATP-binding protein